MGWTWRIWAAAASGVLIALAMPPLSIWPLGWVAIVPLLMASRGQMFIVSFHLGLLASFVLAVVTFSGVMFGYPRGDGAAMYIELGCAIFGVVIGVAAAIFSELPPGDNRRFAAIAAFSVLFEMATLRTLPVSLALTQNSVTSMHMLASVFGMWGVSLLLWGANIFLADRLLRGSTVKWKTWQWMTLAIAAGAVIVGGTVWSRAERPIGRAHIVLVQSDPSEHDDLATMSGHDATALAIWPEFGGIVLAPGGKTDALRRLTQGVDRPAIVTSFRDDYSPLPHNVAALFYQGAESPRYAKRMLFGTEVNMHTAGDRPGAAPWMGNVVGLNICFDSCVAGLVRETARLDGVDLIALPTIDPPAPYHWIAMMHAAFSPFRAAEEGIPIARADGHAFSSAVDGSGNELVKLPPGNRSVALTVPLDRRWTFYRQIGDFILPICLILVVAGVIPGSLWKRLHLPASNRRPREPQSQG